MLIGLLDVFHIKQNIDLQHECLENHLHVTFSRNNTHTHETSPKQILHSSSASMKASSVLPYKNTESS